MLQRKKILQSIFILSLSAVICTVNLNPVLASESMGIKTYDFKAPTTTLDTEVIFQTPITRNVTISSAYAFGNQIQSNPVAYGIYNALRNNIETLKTGTGSIPFTITSSTFTQQDFQAGIDAFDRDYSEVFWIDIEKMQTRYSISSTEIKGNIQLKPGYTNYFSDDYNTSVQVEQDITRVENVINQLTASATGNDYDKVKYFHDYIVDKVEYNQKLFSNQASPKAWEITSGLYYGNTDSNNPDNPVCEGYARALKVLCDRIGIPNLLISGYGNGEAHMWNYVQLDGAWYAVDATWDDPIYRYNASAIQKKENQYKYFMVGSKNFTDHIPDGSIVNGGYVFAYPTLSQTDYVPKTDTPISYKDGAILKNGVYLGQLDELQLTNQTSILQTIQNSLESCSFILNQKAYSAYQVNQLFIQYENTLNYLQILEKVETELDGIML